MYFFFKSSATISQIAMKIWMSTCNGFYYFACSIVDYNIYNYIVKQILSLLG
nr:MAG TPA: hypothetical protein [Caudoviricetes sp.]